MPFTYTPQQREEAVQRVIDGLRIGKPLTVICRSDGMPDDDTVRRWADENPALAGDIARARDAGHDVIAQRTRETARGEGDSSGDVQRDKLIIDTDLKLLAKWNPKRYGERTLIGSDPENPLPPGFNVNLVKTSGNAS